MKILKILSTLLMLVFVASAVAAQEKSTMQTEFDTGIERLRRGDTTVDFRRLRHLWAGLPGYEPYAKGANREATIAAVRRDDAKEALRLARLDLDADYLDIDAHMNAMVASKTTGDEKAFEHHRAIVVGILKSITEFGDGATPATAYVVVTVREEYAVLKAYGLRMKSQGLDRGDEHTFDVLTVVDPDTKKESDIYFNIDLLIEHQEKLLAPEKPAGGVIGGVPGGIPGGIPGSEIEKDPAGGPYRLRAGVLAGRARSRPQAEYPKMASLAGVGGAVVVEVIVSETGAVESARVISGHPLLRDAALAAAKGWVFDATILEGVAVKVVGTITFNFRKG